MSDGAQSVAAAASRVGILWRGHVFLFDKQREAPAYSDAQGRRLLLTAAGLEGLRLTVQRIRPAFLPWWLEAPMYLALALGAVRVICVPWSQIGFNRWTDWNATEKSYLMQVLILLTVVFALMFGDRVRVSLSHPGTLGTVFLPYFVFGFYQEVLYRGLLQTELVRRWGPTLGILASNALYTVGPLHYAYFFSKASLAVPMFGAVFAIGLIFSMVFYRTANLWIVGVMHAFGNAYAIVAFGGAFNR
jgi:membrane protease YdiL (CAAX protease family)